MFKTKPLFAASGSGSGISGKNLNNLLADPEDQEAEQDKGLIQTAYEFFTRLWSPGSSDAQKLGFAYVYGQDGTLLGEYGMGGSASTGTTQYIYLPTANGPMPIAAIVNGVAYAVHSDHLNTPRKLTQPDGQVAWQWAYSAFGDEQPTLGSKRFTNEATNPTTGSTPIPEVTFNLRYPGQYYDKESNLHYNYFRSYSAERGRYTQADPIGLEGGFNRFGYVDANPMTGFDPFGLANSGAVKWMTPPPTRCFSYEKFAEYIEKNRLNLWVVLATLGIDISIGTMPKTAAELRGFGPKSQLNPYTSQLSRLAGFLENRTLRDWGRKPAFIAASAAATGAVVFEGFYDWGIIAQAFDYASSSENCICRN